MAEIKIKKDKPIWPWILLGILAVLAILFFLFVDTDDVDDVDDMDDVEMSDDVDETMAASSPQSKNDIAAYADYVGGNPDVGANYYYAKNALLKLIQAVQSKAAATNTDIDAALGEAQQKAAALTGAEDMEQAEMVREAAEQINQALETIQEGAYPNLDSLMDRVENMASEIDEDDEVMEQHKDFNQYFLSAEKLLLEMGDGLNQKNIDSDAALKKYTAYIGNTGKMGIDHKYSHNALDYLIEATRARANMLDVNINADLDQAMENAHAITKDPYDVNHADLIKNSGKIIAEAIKKIQTEKFPDLQNEVNELDNAVASISKGTHTLDQKNDVNKFFMAASNVLNKMK